jgi:hypothetical protein
MAEVLFIWDLEDDPEGNVQHIAEHGVTMEEVEEVVSAHHRRGTTSRSSGSPAAFGWTETGKYIIVVYERVESDPLTVRPITAYETEPPRRKKGKRHGR